MAVGAWGSSAEAGSASAWASSPHTVVVGYASHAALVAALRDLPATIVRTIPALRTAAVRTRGSAAALAGLLSRARGIRYAQPASARAPQVEPALFASARTSYEWQFAAAREDSVPTSVLRDAANITIAIIDTGADLTAPDLAAKTPATYDVLSGTTDVRDLNGHGTFVASLAAGSVTNGNGIAGFGGDAKLLIVRAGHPDGTFTDVDEAAGIVYAVDHGARIVNLSLGGVSTSQTEMRAVSYAAAHGVLLVAAAGNERQAGNPIEYPAALLQPVGSNGTCDAPFACTGLAVAASTPDGSHASFSNTGSYISLAAPGVNVFGAVAGTSSPSLFPRAPLAGALSGLYGFASGTSFSSPEVAGAAALVWAANPALAAGDVARILKSTASGLGSWSPDLGYGVLDVSAAVAEATGAQTVLVSSVRSRDRVHLTWSGTNATSYRVSAVQDSGPELVLLPSTTRTDAWFHLTPGHGYTFTVGGFAADGTVTAVSAPLYVRVAQATASLSLAAKPVHSTRRVRLTAHLHSTESEVPIASRPVDLQVLLGGRWHDEGAATTGTNGQAIWLLALKPGSYAVRASFGGGDDLAGTQSRQLKLLVVG